jgi:CxxC-x17-CxxC domain-containing protein
MDYSNHWLICEDCGDKFLWDVGEQAWFHGKHLVNQPKHCKVCRDKRRDQRLHQPREYSKVNCDSCGTPTYVPFVPRGIKPIYCRGCMTAVHA